MRTLPLRLLIVLALSGCGHGAIDPAAGRGVAPTRDVVITLLHTNDLHGRAYYPGEARGVTKIATLARRIRDCARGGVASCVACSSAHRSMDG